MKQAEDKFTQDLFPASDAGAKQPKYRVYIELQGGGRLVWDCLTRAQALAMHKSHDKNFNHIRSNMDIARFGWEEMK